LPGVSYFENPPQIQLLHCLRNRVVSGGDSYFVDAFEAANRLRKRNRKAWELLTWAPVPYQYLNDAHHYEFSHPVIQLVPPSLGANRPSEALRHINWSPPFQAPLPARGAKPLLDAMAAFDAEVRRPHLEYKTRMNEGDLVNFDNRRILHARTAFVEPEAPPGAPSEPSRWLKGGYVDGDAAWDIFRVLVAASARSA
jgi:gamma-butyrobetaine dioxygenase